MPDGTYLAGPGPGQQQKPDSLAIRPGMFDDIVGPGPDSTTQSAAAPATPPQGLDIRPGMFDDIVGPSASPSASTEQPSFFQRVGAALRGYLPQPGEGVLHTAGRDVTGLAKGFAKPFGTLYLGGLGDFLKPGDAVQAPTPAQTALAGVQVATTVEAGPLEGAIAKRLGGGLAARVLAGAGVGAGAGAVFNPQDPGVGAFLGGAIGAPLGALHAPPKPKVAPETPFAEPPSVDDMLNNVRQNAAEMLRRSRPVSEGGNGGFSFDPRTGKFLDKNGFFVGMGNDQGVFSRTGPNAITDADEQAGQGLEDVVTKNPELFQRGNVALGGWRDSGALHAEPSQIYNDINPAFMSAYERGQVATGGFINGEWHEVPTQGPEAQRVYELAKQYGKAPTQIQEYFDARGEQGNAVSEALERIGSAAKAAQRAAAAGSAAGVGAASSQGTGVLQRVAQGGGGAEGGGAGDVPPGGGAPPPPNEPPAGSVGGDDEGSRPGPSGYGFTVDEESSLLDKLLNSDKYFSKYLNLSKIRATGDVQKAAIRGALYRAINENRLDPKLRVTWEQTQAGARNMLDNMTPQELAAFGAKQMREGAGVMSPSVDFAHRVAAGHLNQEFEGLSAAIRDRNIPINQAHELTDKLRQVSDDHVALLKNLSPAHSEAGRVLNALKIAANQTTDPTYWLIRAMKMRDGAPLNADEHLEISEALQKVKDAPTAFQRQRWQNLLAAKVYGMKYMTPWQKAASVYRASLLSSPSSLLGAAIGHTAFAGVDAADKNLAGFYDWMLSGITHQRTTPFAPVADFRARIRGMAAATKDLKRLMLSGSSDVQGVVDQKEVSWDRLGDQASANLLERATDPLLRTGNVMFGIGSKFVLRLYGNVPHILRAGAMEASLESQARLIGMSEGLGGKLLEERIRALRSKWAVDGAPDGVQRQAWEDGAVAALTNRGVLARAASGFKTGVQAYFGGPGRLAADVAMPFTTVPSNLIEQGAKHIFAWPYAGAQLVKLFGKSIEGQAKADLQRAAVANMARGSTGAAAMFAGYLLAKHGLATGPANDPDRRAIAVMTGRQPDAIRLGPEWYNDARFAPITEMVEMGIYAHDYFNNPRQITETTDPNESKQVGFLKGAGEAFAHTVADAPFAQGVKYISDAITEPGNIAKNYVQDVARGVVPTFISHAEEAMDPYVRQPDITHGFARDLEQTIESRIPIPAIYNRVPVKPNPLGLPTTHETGVVAGFTPYPATADQTLTDPVMKAISESQVSLPAIKLAPGESESEYQARVQEIARTAYGRLSQLVNSARWQEIDQQAVRAAARPGMPYTPAEIAQHFRQELIKGVVSKAKAQAARKTSPHANAPAILRGIILPHTDDDSSTPNE